MADTRITEPSFPRYQEKDGEEYMNEPQQEHFRQILLQWKQELLAEMSRTRSQMRGEAEILADPNDRATQEEEFTIELRARERERNLVRKIEISLRAIDSGEYGYCESCGIEIGLRRLQARPTATKCIDCKTMDEVRERQMME